MAYRAALLILIFGFTFPAFGKDRVEKESCGRNTTKARSISKVCLGKLSESGRGLVVLEMADGSDRLLEETKTKTSGFGEQEFGDVTYQVTLVELDEDFKQLPKKKSKAIIHSTWEYSDGNTEVRGQTHDKKSFDALVESDAKDEAVAKVKTKDIFTCKISERGEEVTVQFGIGDMATRKVALLDLQPKVEGEPIVITPKALKDGAESSLNALNAQGGDLSMGNTRLSLLGDDDGETMVHLILYKNNGFKKGYVRVDIDTPPGQKDSSWYSKISCDRTSSTN